jgi:hypothetical protein
MKISVDTVDTFHSIIGMKPLYLSYRVWMTVQEGGDASVVNGGVFTLGWGEVPYYFLGR